MGASWWQEWNNKNKLKCSARTQFKPRQSCVVPKRDRSQIQPHGPHGHKQLFKFQLIRCTKCSTSTPAGKGHACCLFCHAEMRKACGKRKFVVVRHGSKREGMKVPRVHKGRREPQDCTKWWETERPTVALYVTRITSLKMSMVNSVIRSVNIHRQSGFLQWPYGTMSEPP